MTQKFWDGPCRLAMLCLVVTLGLFVAATPASAQFNGGSSASVTYATFASPPPPILNQAYLFTDASAPGVCTGGGSSKSWCVGNGSSFVATSGTSTGMGDSGANGIYYRNGLGTGIPATATELSAAIICTSTGTANALACNLSPAIASYQAKTLYWVMPNATNTGAATVNLNSKGALTLKKIVGGSTLDLNAGDIQSGFPFGFIYDGTFAQVVTQLGNKTNAPLVSGDIPDLSATYSVKTCTGTDLTGTLPGCTVAQVGTSTATNIHTAEVAANAATNANTVSTIVKRDSSGNFSAGTITASLTGLASLNELPLTFGAGLNRSTNTITIPAGGVTNAMLAGSIDLTSKVTGLLPAGNLPAVAVQTGISNAYTAGTQDFTGAAHTLPFKAGTIGNIPATCTEGEGYFSKSATAGSNIYLCTDNANTWTPVTGTGGTGNVTGPGSSTTGNLATYGDTTGKTLVDTLALVTTVGVTGSDTNVPTEKAVRTAIAGSVSGVASVGGATGAVTLTGPISISGQAVQCPTCVVASTPGAGIAHFAGSTQTATSSLIVTTDITDANVTLAKMANLAQATVIGRADGAGAGVPQALATIPTGTVPAFAGGDVTSVGATLVLTVGGINGTSFAGTNGHLVSFGASNTPSDSGVVAANAITDASNLTNHGVAIASGNKTVGSTAVGTTDHPLVGVSAADPAFSKLTLTNPATGSTFTLADGKTFTVSNTLTFTGTDASSVAFGTGGTVAYTANNLSVFAATTSAQLRGVLSDETGTGAAVFAGGNIGAATMTSLNKVAITAPTTAATLVLGTDNATLTFQGTGTVVNRDSTDTLTNKSIAASEVNSGTLAAAQMPAFTGDATNVAGAVALTLATVNAGPGACGDATHFCVPTTNGKGLVTSQATQAAGQPAAPISVTQTGATAAFTCTSNTNNEFAITLTAAVTSSTLSCSSGAHLVFHVNVGTGPYALTFPTGFNAMGTPIPQASVTTTQACYWDGSACNPEGPATADSGFGQLAEVAAPTGNPSANSQYFWADNTAHTPQSRDTSGNVNSMVRTSAGGVSCGSSCEQVVDYVSALGTPHTFQVRFTDLSGRATEAQLPTTAVVTDAASTYTSGLQDFSGVAIKFHSGAGLTTGASDMLAYNSTTGNPQVWAGGANGLIATFASAPTSGHCVTATVTSGFVNLTDAGAACGTGGSGTVTHTGGALTSGQILFGNGGADIKTGDLSGVIQTSGSGVTTFNGGGTTVPYVNLPNQVACAGSNDTTAVQAATASGTWQFPLNGTCAISNVTFSSNNVNWQGNGVTFKNIGSAGNFELSSSGVTNINLQNFTVDLNGTSLTNTYHVPVYFTSTTGMVMRDVTFINSGSSVSDTGAISFNGVSGEINHITVASTVPGTYTGGAQVVVFSTPANSSLAVKNSTFLGGTSNQLQVSYGATGSDVFLLDNYFYNGGQQAGSLGMTGNAILVYQLASKLTIQGNHIYSPIYSGIRLNNPNAASAQVTVEGNIVDGAGETSIYDEGGSQHSLISNNVVTNGSAGITSTNITFNHRPDTITGNKILNMNSFCIHSENDLITGNTCSDAPIGIDMGAGGTGFGITAYNNTFNNVTQKYNVSGGLSNNGGFSCVSTPTACIANGNAPLNVIGPTVVQGVTAGSGSGASSGMNGSAPVVPDYATVNSYCVITGITTGATTTITYTTGGSCVNPTSSPANVVMFRSIMGTTQLNGQLGMVTSASAGSITVSINSTGYGAFAPQGACGSTNICDNTPSFSTMYTSGTTPVASLPSWLRIGEQFTGQSGNIVTDDITSLSALATVNGSTVPAGVTLMGRTTTDTMTGKTYDTAGSGNVFKINGTAISAISGTGSVCMTTNCAMTTPNLGTPSALTLTNATGLPTAGLVANAVTSAKMAVVNTYRVCDLYFGDQSGSALTNGQLGPQSRMCFIPAAATIVEMDVNGDAGTPNIIIGRNRAGTIVNIVSAALATAASGGIACSNTGGTTGLNGATTCSSTLQNTGLNAGDYLEAVSGTAGGTAKSMAAHIVYTVN